ncbi:hypothetical protein ZIOFF_052985 [Zingiber officinale]|uniref:Uncharacterized protein n=1 Tax=Zingiber officinale TaxID=94328 RepID=A0A8J5FCJ7_ZINOF|nr:hypothetical protein ZIOFF_052985 [Zingiber officinale]
MEFSVKPLLLLALIFATSVPCLEGRNIKNKPENYKPQNFFGYGGFYGNPMGPQLGFSAPGFGTVLDDVLEGRKQPSELSRISIHVNGNLFPTYALNDILVAHPCPATVSRFSFRIKDDRTSSSLVSSRSSGLRISTAAGSTAAILSAGGIPMAISSQDLQYMAREPISPRVAEVPLLRGFVKPEQLMLIDWYTQEGVIYVDGCHVTCPLRYGNRVEVSAKAPILKVYLPREFLRDCSVTYHQPQSEL